VLCDSHIPTSGSRATVIPYLRVIETSVLAFGLIPTELPRFQG
jgi:hypothetical protein